MAFHTRVSASSRSSASMLSSKAPVRLSELGLGQDVGQIGSCRPVSCRPGMQQQHVHDFGMRHETCLARDPQDP